MAEYQPERRRSMLEIYAWMRSIEQIQRQLEEGQLNIRNELVGFRELVGKDIRAYELFKRVIVSLDSNMEYEHDTVILMNDEERSLIRQLISGQRRQNARAQVEEEHRQWWQKWWGRLVIGGTALVGTSTAIVNAIEVLGKLHHP